MEIVQYLIHGFDVATQPINLFYCLVGVLAGSLVGVLPAIGPPAAVALLLPTVYHLSPVGGIIMLAGINYGAMYGGSITSILVNVPGEASSVVTCLDGYPMALKGRAGPALGITAFGSYIAGNLSIIGLMLFAPALGRMAVKLGSPEYFTLMVMSLTIVAYMIRGSMLKAMMMVAVGLILSTVGMDMVTSKFRFTYNLLYLQDGIPLVPVVIGMFGLREVFHNFQTTFHAELLTTKIGGLLPSWQDWKDSLLPILRGGTLGFFMGILPGISPMIPTFLSYGLEKKLSKHPEKFGTGAIEGVAGPEACNNAVVCGSQVPLFSLGLPTTTMNSMLLAALMIFGMSPGPQFINKSPDLFWGLIASMYIGNGMLLILNLPLIPLWVKVLRIPFILLSMLILIFCAIGAYSINRQPGDLYLLFIFGLIGFLTKKFAYEPAPLILAFILGPIIENSLRQSLIFSDGDFSVFVTRPVAAIFLALTIFVIVISLRGAKKRIGSEPREAKQEGTAKQDKYVAVFCLLFGIFILVGALGLDVGGLHQPGPGLFPAFSTVLLSLLSIVLLIRSTLLAAKREKQAAPQDPKACIPYYCFGGCIVYALMFEWLGFLLATFLLVVFLSKMLEKKEWWKVLLTGAIISFSVFFIFDGLLGSKLPKGIFKAFL